MALTHDLERANAEEEKTEEWNRSGSIIEKTAFIRNNMKHIFKKKNLMLTMERYKNVCEVIGNAPSGKKYMGYNTFSNIMNGTKKTMKKLFMDGLNKYIELEKKC